MQKRGLGGVKQRVKLRQKHKKCEWITSTRLREYRLGLYVNWIGAPGKEGIGRK